MKNISINIALLGHAKHGKTMLKSVLDSYREEVISNKKYDSYAI